MSHISVIVPSRLAVNPTSEHGRLWLDRALMSVRRQTVFTQHTFEFIVGIDCDAPEPPERFSDVNFRRSAGKGQAQAVNAAVAASTGAVLVYAEDDDYSYPRKLELQLPYLGLIDQKHDWALSGEPTPIGAGKVIDNWQCKRCFSYAKGARVASDDPGAKESELALELLDLNELMPRCPERTYDLVTCNSREIDEYANFIRVNDFATGWVMKRALWDEIGGFDESFRWHVDTEFLGRVNAAGKKRVHLVNDGRAPATSDWLARVQQHSEIAWTGEHEPLVGRLVNPAGGMSRIARDPEAAAQSREEHERMFERFKEIPW